MHSPDIALIAVLTGVVHTANHRDHGPHLAGRPHPTSPPRRPGDPAPAAVRTAPLTRTTAGTCAPSWGSDGQDVRRDEFSKEASVCIERQHGRPIGRAVPEQVVTDQHRAMVASHPNLRAASFDGVVFSDPLYRLEPLLSQISEIRVRKLGTGGSDGLGDLLLPRCYLGPEILPLWRWKGGSTLAGGDRAAEIRIGEQHFTLAWRTDIDGEGSAGFEALVPCPFDDECEGEAWLPVYDVTGLWEVLTGGRDQDADITCTIHGNFGDADPDLDPGD